MPTKLDDFKENHEEKPLQTGRKIRVGIIGTGGIAHAHIRSYLIQPDVELVAFADIVPGKAQAFADEFHIAGAKCYESAAGMLADQPALRLDAVSICTYNCEHASCAIAALDAGLHVLLEKPFTVTADEAVEVMRAERRSGKILSIGFQPRFDDNMKNLAAIVASGVLGKIYYVQTGGGRRRGIPVYAGRERQTFIEEETAGYGALGDIGCYSLDMVLHALGYPKPLTATGYTSDFFGKDPDYVTYRALGDRSLAKKFGVDDFAAGFIRLAGGVILDFRISWAMKMDTSGDTLIYGTKGGLRIPSTECWNGSIGGDMTIYHEVAGKQVETKIAKIDPKPGAPSNFDRKIRTFIDAIEAGGRAPVPTSEILYNQLILDALKRSAALGREVRISIPKI